MDHRGRQCYFPQGLTKLDQRLHLGSPVRKADMEEAGLHSPHAHLLCSLEAGTQRQTGNGRDGMPARRELHR